MNDLAHQPSPVKISESSAIASGQIRSQLPQNLSSFETWGFGATGLLLWFGVAPAMHIELGEQAIWVWIPCVVASVLLNLQIKRLGMQWPEMSGGYAQLCSPIAGRLSLNCSVCSDRLLVGLGISASDQCDYFGGSNQIYFAGI